MKCLFRRLENGYWHCPRCGYTSKRPLANAPNKTCLGDDQQPPLTRITPPDHGPGTELQKLVAQLGVKPDSSCNCEAMRQRMNAWGTAGCRAHREEIIAHLRTAYSRTDWPTVFAAALAGAAHLWLVRRINPLHPIESGLNALLEEAIERAEKAAAK